MARDVDKWEHRGTVMGENEQNRRDLLRDIVVAVPALGVGALLASGVMARRQSDDRARRELELELEHRYPGWTESDYSTEVIASTLVNEGRVAERDIRWQVRVASAPGTELMSWDLDQASRPNAATVTVVAPATPSPDFSENVATASVSEELTGPESVAVTMFSIVVRRLDPGEAVRLEATFRGMLTLVMHEAQSDETMANGYLRIWSAATATPSSP